MPYAPRPCEEKERLRKALVAALQQLREATGVLRWAQYGQDFLDALDTTQKARTKYESARRTLEDHRKDHAC